MFRKRTLGEVRVFEGLFSGDTLLGVVGEELGEKVETVRSGVLERLSERRESASRERERVSMMARRGQIEPG
jgi:hypothetical protein